MGRAAVRIHTIRSSFWKPLLLSSVSSSSYTFFFQFRGRAKSLKAAFRSPGGFRNFICLSDGHAIPVRIRGIEPFCFSENTLSSSLKNEISVVKKNIFYAKTNVPLNKELAMAPQGAIGIFVPFVVANGIQSDDGVLLSCPRSWLSSRDFTYRRWFW